METIKKDIKATYTADVSSSFSLTDSQIEAMAAVNFNYISHSTF